MFLGGGAVWFWLIVWGFFFLKKNKPRGLESK